MYSAWIGHYQIIITCGYCLRCRIKWGGFLKSRNIAHVSFAHLFIASVWTKRRSRASIAHVTQLASPFQTERQKMALKMVGFLKGSVLNRLHRPSEWGWQTINQCRGGDGPLGRDGGTRRCDVLSNNKLNKLTVCVCLVQLGVIQWGLQVSVSSQYDYNCLLHVLLKCYYRCTISESHQYHPENVDISPLFWSESSKLIFEHAFIVLPSSKAEGLLKSRLLCLNISILFMLFNL